MSGTDSVETFSVIVVASACFGVDFSGVVYLGSVTTGIAVVSTVSTVGTAGALLLVGTSGTIVGSTGIVG